ncbi:Rrf2 family transcriptional regulator [Flammeovirga pectinis]|uniref:Rrf2 family transcriptional regulator n=1 Tax=Flammeovirga pectinis TaxID=2494373 RepID=A0A3S9P9A9_9BACT|nr:Rrf2 family transcriptional regulator [Flammeovirga pectinis]AZQ64790.1 Rrf2 family transcriptional regulator [Flammeovirga pectinis]
MFSKACQYGLKAVIFLGKESAKGNKVGVNEIAEAIDSPKAFTSKVLQSLSKKKIVTSVKGPYGGFYINKEVCTSTSLSEIVKIIDGDKVYTACLLGFNSCDKENPCPMHDRFVEVRENLKKKLEATTVQVLIDEIGLDFFNFK